MAETLETPKAESYSFQAEIKQLLHLLSHSLYQSKEIALRELISNASDALDKMRYVQLTDESRRDDRPLEIQIEAKPDESLLIIRDNGIGMTHDEVVKNLGTIAHSGSLEFLKTLASQKQDASKPADVSLIGQFGVGFYSAFMLADNVRVRTRGYASEQGWEWASDGSGAFTVTEADGLPRGTEIRLHLKDEAKDFAQDWKVSSTVKRYSSFVPHPIKVGDEVVNSQKPIWVEPKNQVTDEQHTQFYQHLTHHADESPLWHLHMAADSPIQFRGLLYCPTTNIEKLGFGRTEHGLNLLAKRVLVQSDCRELRPEYLRFLYGLVDSEDLPLNVSRETLQDNAVIRRIRTVLVKQVLDRLDKLAEESAEKYLEFFRQFGTILREGVALDPPQRERIAKLLRFTSSFTNPDALTSLDDYASRFVEGQKAIYFLGGPDLATLRKNPSLEIFRKRGIEVLYLTDPVDEFVMTALGKYKDHPLLSIDAADVEVPEGTRAATDGAESKPEDESKAESEASKNPAGLERVISLFREALGARVQDVRVSKRLTDSPCVLVNAEGGMSAQLQRLMKMSNQDFAPSARILELNPKAPLIERLAGLSTNDAHADFIRQTGWMLWANAQILEGTLPEVEDFTSKLQGLLEEAANGKSVLIL